MTTTKWQIGDLVKLNDGYEDAIGIVVKKVGAKKYTVHWIDGHHPTDEFSNENYTVISTKPARKKK